MYIHSAQLFITRVAKKKSYCSPFPYLIGLSDEKEKEKEENFFSRDASLSDFHRREKLVQSPIYFTTDETSYRRGGGGGKTNSASILVFLFLIFE